MKQLEHFDSPHPNPLHQEREPVVEVISYAFLNLISRHRAIAIARPGIDSAG